MKTFKRTNASLMLLFFCLTLFRNLKAQNNSVNETLTDTESTSDLQKIFQSIIDFSNEENTPKQIVSIILTDITQRFDQIIPTLKDSTNIKSTEKLEAFQSNLNEVKQNFTIDKISNLKDNLNDFINDNKEFLKVDPSSEKIIIENFQSFRDSLSSIISELKKLNIKNINGVNYKEIIDKKPNITESNLPRECTPECKCCRDNLCVAEEICLNSQKDDNKQTEEYSAILLSTPFIIFIAFVLFIFAVYVFRKQIFRIEPSLGPVNGYNRQTNVLEISNPNIEMS